MCPIRNQGEDHGLHDSEGEEVESDPEEGSDLSDLSDQEGMNESGENTDEDLAHEARMAALRAENRQLSEIVAEQDRVLEEIKQRTLEIQVCYFLRQVQTDMV